MYSLNEQQINKKKKNKTDDDWHSNCNKSIKVQRKYQRNKKKILFRIKIKKKIIIRYILNFRSNL